MLLRAYALKGIIDMSWQVIFHQEFEPEFDDLPETVQDEINSTIEILELMGPRLGRKRVDTLRNSRHANMKEMRFNAADGVWRVAFAFDPKQRGVVLVAADKSGTNQRRFYRQLIRSAHQRFDDHLAALSN